MNIWMQQSADSFLKLDDIERAIIPRFDIRGREVYIGLTIRCLVIIQPLHLLSLSR